MPEWWESFGSVVDEPIQSNAQPQPEARDWLDDHTILVEDTGQSQLSSAFGAAGQGALSVPAGVLGGVDALGSIVGLGSDSLRGASQSIREFGQQYSPVNPVYAQSFPVEATGAVGQAAAQLASLPVGGALGKAVGLAGGAVRGAQIAGLGSGALMGADAGQETADRLGIENRAQRAAMILGQAGIELGTEMLGGFGSKEFTQGILGQLSGMPWKQGASGILRTALTEGGEEALAGTAQPLLERAVLLGEEAPSGAELTGIPLTSVDATLDVLKQGALGAVAGGFMGGVNAFINRPESKNVLNFRLKAKARINELQNSPQLTEEEQRELTELETEDQNAAQWLQDYGEQNVYEPLRQVVDPTSEWRNQRESLIADTQDQTQRENLRRQTDEEIEAASEVLGRDGNPFSQESTTSALNEALTPPDPQTEAIIQEASNDPTVVQTKEIANEVASAGAPATAAVLAEQANAQAVENVVAIEQFNESTFQQRLDEIVKPTGIPLPKLPGQTLSPAPPSSSNSENLSPARVIGQVGQLFTDANQSEIADLPPQVRSLYERMPQEYKDAFFRQASASRGVQESEDFLDDDAAELVRQFSQEDPLYGDAVRWLNDQAYGVVDSTAVQNETTTPITESVEQQEASSPQGVAEGARSDSVELESGELLQVGRPGVSIPESQANQGELRDIPATEGDLRSGQESGAIESPQPTERDNPLIAFESALRAEVSALPAWTPARIEEALQWFRDGKQGTPSFGVGPVNRAVLASDREARKEWVAKEKALLTRFKRAESEDQPEIDDQTAKRRIEERVSEYSEIPAEELSLSAVFPVTSTEGLSNAQLAREIRNVRADFNLFKESFRDVLQPFQSSYRELSSQLGAQEAWRSLEESNPEGSRAYDRFLEKAANLSRLEAEMENRGLNPDEPIPEGLEDYVPPKPRRTPNTPLKQKPAQGIQKAWEAISATDEAFRGKKSTAKGPAALAREMSGGTVTAYTNPADGSINFRSPNGTISIENPDSKRPYIYALGAQSEGRAQGGGSLLYQIAFAWAHNNGKKIFPSNNLTEINAYVRRTSNMLSSALRYGTTKHLTPDRDQRVSGWKNGDDKGNTARLAWRESQQVLKAIPEAENIRYDFQTGEFYTNQPQDASRPSEAQVAEQERRILSPQDLEEIISESLDGGYANELGIGETTLKRAIITNTAAQDIEQVTALPRGILYSDSEATGGVTRKEVEQALSELNSTPLGKRIAQGAVVVDNLEDLRRVTENRPLPERAYDLISLAEGFFRPITGESYIILDRVSQKNGESKVDSIKRVIFHERAFHGGFKWMYANDWQFARKADRIVEMIPKAERDELADYPGVGNSNIAILEEWLARKFQQGDPNELAQQDPLFRRIWNAIKDLIASILGKPVTSEQVDREARELVGQILRNRQAFGNQALPIEEDLVSPAEPSASFSIPFSQDAANKNRQQVKEEAGFLPDAPDSMVQAHQFMGNLTEEAYVVQTIRPQADFVRERIWKGGLDENNQPFVNEQNIQAFWRENDRMTSDPEWAANIQDDFREMAANSQSTEIRNNRAEAIGSVAQLELMNFAQLMAADGTQDAQMAVDAIRRGRFYNDTTLLRYANISGMARNMQARAAASRNGMMGFWTAFKQLDDAKDKAVSTKVGTGNVRKIQTAVNNPEDGDIDTRGIEDPVEESELTEDQRLGIARDNEVQRIIDKIDESRTEWIGPPQNRSKIQALKREAISSELTDPTRPGHLTRDQFVRRYAQGFQSLGVSPALSINLSSRLYEENRRIKTDTFMRQMDSRVKNSGVNQLAKDLLSDPLNILGDPALMREKMIEWLKGTGLTEEQATRWAKRHQAVFREKLIKAKEKALDRAIKGVKTITTPSVERIRQAIRAGALDPSTGVRDAIAEALGAKGLTKEDMQKMASADLKMRDAGPVDQQIQLSKIAEILQSKMPDTTTGRRILESYVQSVLAGLSTQTLSFVVPFFNNMTRLGTSIGETSVAAMLGRMPKSEVPTAIYASINDYVESYKAYVSSFATVWKNDITTIHHIDNLNYINSLREDFRRQIEKFKNGTPLQKVKTIIPLAQASTDIVRRVMNASDGAALAVFKQVFARQGARKLLSSGPNRLTTAQVGLMFQQAQNKGQAVAEDAFAHKGYSPAEAQQLGFDAMNEYVYAEVSRLLSATDASQLRDFVSKEAAYELGVSPPDSKSENVPAGDVFFHVARMIQSASNYMSRESPLLGRMLLGFVSIPTNLANRSLSYTPYGLLRYFWKSQDLKKGNDELYLNSMGSEIQRRQRFVEGVAGTTAMLILATLAYANGDEEDKDYTGLRIVGAGPKDPALREAWLKAGFKPNSITWMSNGKPVASVPFGRGGLEGVKLAMVGVAALDDMRLNGELQDGNILEHTGDWVKSSLVAGLEATSYFGLKSIASAVSVADSRATEASVYSQALWTTSGLIPWSGLMRSVTRPFIGPMDTSSAQAAITAQIPMAGLFTGENARNFLGEVKGPQPVDLFTKASDRLYLLGLPLYLGISPDSPNGKAYELFISKGNAPSVPSRSRLTQEFGGVTEQQWSRYLITRGNFIKKQVSSRYNELKALDRAAFGDAISSISTTATKEAKRAVFGKR